MKIRLHKVNGQQISVFPLGYWLRYRCKVTGVSLIIGKTELGIGDCLTFKRFAEMICES